HETADQEMVNEVLQAHQLASVLGWRFPIVGFCRIRLFDTMLFLECRGVTCTGGTEMNSRRAFLKIAGVATACATVGTRLLAGAEEPALGLIFPPLNSPIPPDAKRLYPTGVEFLGNGVGLPGGMTLEGYDEAIPRVLPAAEELAKRGAKVISVFGSSLTFYKGAKFNEELTQKVTKLTGVPATTQSNG